MKKNQINNENGILFISTLCVCKHLVLYVVQKQNVEECGCNNSVYRVYIVYVYQQNGTLISFNVEQMKHYYYGFV